MGSLSTRSSSKLELHTTRRPFSVSRALEVVEFSGWLQYQHPPPELTVLHGILPIKAVLENALIAELRIDR